MLISLTNLAAMRKIQKNIWTKVRLVGLININTKEWQNMPPFMKVVYVTAFLPTGLFLAYFFFRERKAVPVQWRSDVN